MAINSTSNQIGLFFFSMILVGMILIPSQSQLVFAGAGIYEDKDFDGFSPFQGDCNDNDRNVYPGQGCDPVAYVKYTIDLMLEIVENGENDISDGQVKALLKILNNAIDKFDSDNTNAAVGMLKAFIHQIDVLIKNDKISPEDGEELIQTVQLLLKSL